jgi:hypothetical protein
LYKGSKEHLREKEKRRKGSDLNVNRGESRWAWNK